MRGYKRPAVSGKARMVAAVLAAAALCAGFLPAGAGTSARAQTPNGGATFDFFSMYPEQYVAPQAGELSTFMPLDVRNIGQASGEVGLVPSCDSGYFKVGVDNPKLTPKGEDGVASTRVAVECEKGTPEDTVGWIKVIGTRGEEAHHIWLKCTALDSRPLLQTSRGIPFTGQGYLDPELQEYVGDPVVWHLSAKNEGASDETYELGSRADFPCKVTWKDINGKVIRNAKVNGRTRNLLFSKPYEMSVEVVPTEPLPRNEVKEVTLLLGPGKYTEETSEVKVSLVNPGMLFCLNDLGGLKPRAHQVMPGEQTSFILHVTNLEADSQDIKLTVEEDAEGWDVKPESGDIKGLAPGKTDEVVVRATAPGAAPAGERLGITVTAKSTSGRTETSRLAAEVTDVRNIYYWSIDSMDPEYLYLDEKGTGPGKDGDWLMPETQAFLSEGTNYTDARVYLPSATDMNHTNALAGTYTGTMGVYMVGGTFKGFGPHDETLSGPNTLDLLRYGPDGLPVERMYEVAKQQTGGKATTGFWSNKNWLADLEAERSVDIEGTSEKHPLFYKPPYKYSAAGDPQTDTDPEDRLSANIKCAFHSNNTRAVLIPTLLGQFDLVVGTRLLSAPLSLFFGKNPGLHAEDRYLADGFFRSLEEEDPDVSYVNIADLDNTGHFTGASWPQNEWKKGKDSPSDDTDIYSPWMRRDECFDIAREADVLFGEFLDKLKERGVYDNSIVVVLSDHGMENAKDPKDGYEAIDLRSVLRDRGYLRHEDYEEVGGTAMNCLWVLKPERAADIQKVLEEYTVTDQVLGPVKPLTVLNRQEMLDGKDFGEAGRVRPRELYSEWWINHPDSDNGEEWPDLFVFPLYNYQTLAHGDALASGINNVGIGFGINVPESVQFGLPGIHGGLQTAYVPLVFKAPAGTDAYAPGRVYDREVEIGDIAPTIYEIMGWPAPGCVDGKPLP
ncbi:MAG: alkaline phosphatase family protein [Actinobacteria bacterium]|nr:alkaline phosphatase family protein [Actinomycetota bacterium]MBU1942596.1 alkaline phosphatase family protein [Actinomycetota bacterium]MBU2688728.1 alkaline phosphatase family protein [Actinomycetota bacterium]